MSSRTKSVQRGIRERWVDLFARAGMVAVVAFVVLQLKEFIDANAFDTVGTATDAVLIAIGYLVLNAVLMWAKS
jgi:hypothetical protein